MASAYVKEKSIVITGGTVGLGLALIRECLENGAKNVAVLDINDADNVVGGLQKEFVEQKVIYLKTDVTDRENVRSSIRQAKKEFGVIDVVIGNAGILNEREPEQTVAVNLLGVIHSTYAAIAEMSLTGDGKGGVIVNISSILGLDTVNSSPSYNASKFGVTGLMRSLGTEIFEKLHGIKFITLCPGFTESNMITTANLKQGMTWGIGMDEMTLAQSTMGTQKASVFAKIAVNVLNESKTGSIWIINNGSQQEVVAKTYWKNF